MKPASLIVTTLIRTTHTSALHHQSQDVIHFVATHIEDSEKSKRLLLSIV